MTGAAMLVIDPEFHALIPALSADEFALLEASILAEGCRDALVTWNGVLIDGHNRYAICQRHDLPYAVIERDFESREDVIIWMCTNQLGKRNLTPMTRGELALRIKAAIALKAKGQQGARTDLLQNSTKSFDPINTRQELADIADTSADTIRKIEIIRDDAPEPLAEAAREGLISVHRAFKLTQQLTQLPEADRREATFLVGDEVSKAETLARLQKSAGSPESNGTYAEILSSGGFHYGEDMRDWCDYITSSQREIDAALRSVADWHKKLAIEAKREEKRQNARQLPEGIYNVLYADPPWEYDNTGLNGAAEHHYDTMSIDDIYAQLSRLPKVRITDNAVLFMWVTNPLLVEGLECIERWGFEYKTQLVWIKTELQKPGVGWYVRGRHELLLIATRGSFTPLNEHISPPIGSVLEAPIREHSRKPDEVYTIIERLYPDCQYIELFARHTREGWAAWGNEVGG